jgi:transposase InsO family protein
LDRNRLSEAPKFASTGSGCRAYSPIAAPSSAAPRATNELYRAVEDIDHSRTKTKSPQTNGICERFHRTVLDEFYRVAFRKKIYRTIEELQADLDAWLGDPTRAAGASARRRCKPSLTPSPWRWRNSWQLDHDRQTHRFRQPADRKIKS